MSIFSFQERQGDLGPPPPPFRVGGEGEPRRSGGQQWVFLIGVVLFLLIVGGASKELYTEWLWFENVGYTQVYFLSLGARVVLFAAAALAFFVFLLANIWIARRLAPGQAGAPANTEEARLARRMATLITVAAGLVLAFLFGSSASGEWARVLLYVNAQPFGVQDPVFGQDVGFHVFSMPLLRFIQIWGTGALVVTLIGAVVVYGLALSIQPRAVGRAIRAHISILGIGIFLLLAFGYWLDRFDLMYAPGGVVFGPGFTEVSARLPVLTILTVLAVVAAVLLAINIFMRGIQVPALGVAAWAVVALVGGGLYPEFVQRIQVQPNELSKERPYLENNIRFTRQAFGLDRIEDVAFPGTDQPTVEEIKANPETVDNVRLWDHEPLKVTYCQIQAIRRYYDFHDVDIDRYTIAGKYRQVMLSARELNPDKLALAGEAPTWVNQRLKFTHGYGLTLSPVNEISGEGLPNLLVKNLPPVSTPPIPELAVTRPEIYFGETTNDWVIVNSNEEELDYASETETKFTRYAGAGGVLLDSFLKRAIFAWQMADPNILLTDLRPESRILFYRQIRERVAHIAPFLTLDKDPYVVVFNGRLVYIQDAYTITDRYPYSETYRRSFNYIRNSVKVVVDAYDGSADFYIADPSDPIILTYARIFPGLFKPLEQMPEALRAHIRYPEDLFNAQAEMYQLYHVQDPQVFYNKEDAYTRPQELYMESTTPKPMDAYYLIMRVPGQEKAEFVLILPFTPAGKPNTNAWLAARSDAPNYGKLLAFSFPKEKVIYGPNQIEARINQDTVISPQFSLWNQSGSRVLRGNLLFIPIGESYMYVEPIYLQSEQGQLPELKRVIVAIGNRIAMESTLEASLSAIYGAQLKGPPARPEATPSAPTAGQPQPPSTGAPKAVADLAREAQDHFDKAQERLRAGDWSGYGSELQQLQSILKQMVELSQP